MVAKIKENIQTGVQALRPWGATLELDSGRGIQRSAAVDWSFGFYSFLNLFHGVIKKAMVL
jgi:hypothetical protein